MKYLTQNGKMKASGEGKYLIYNWGIPAYQSATGLRTCPAAGACAKGCYATQGSYQYPVVRNAYEGRLALAEAGRLGELQSDLDELQRKAIKANKQPVVRVHDSGDFYSLKYVKDWFTLMNANQRVLFYAYTKQVRLFKALEENNELPVNLVLIYSEGGIFDADIKDTDRHSRVFGTLEELRSAGYVDTTENDANAFLSRKVGLVYHGFQSRKWSTAK